MAEPVEYPYLDDEERDIIESYRNGEWTPVSDAEYASKIAVLRAAARNQLGLPAADASPIPPRPGRDYRPTTPTNQKEQ